MPSAEAVIWAATVGLILIMLAIIGYLISNGFTNLRADIKAELKTLWLKIDLHQTQAMANSLAISAIQAGCKERHANHRRTGDDK